MTITRILVGVACAVAMIALSHYWIRRIARESRLRQRAEKKLVDMTETLRAGVFQLKQEAAGAVTIEFSNGLARQLARIPDGCESETDPFTFLQYIDAADKQRVEQRIGVCLATRDDFHETFRFWFPDGQLGWILAEAHRMENDADGPIWNGYLFDLTRERTLHERLNRILITRDEFVAAAGHELRTPIQNVSLALDAVNANVLNKADTQRLLAARIATSDLEDLVNDFMEISNITTGAARIRNEPFDLHELISSICRSFTGASQAKGVNYAQIVDPSVPRFIHSDSLRVKQILYNLIGNAFKYTDVGQVSVRVRCSSRAHNHENVRTIDFIISDTGIGIPAQFVPVIFEPFATVGQQSRTSSGLGLAICDRLVSLLGGRITVDSEEGTGSTFIVSLPYNAGSHELCDPDELSETGDLFGDTLSMTQALNEADLDDLDMTRQSAEDRVDSHSNTLIVVDDSYMVRDMLASLLEMEGWDVMQADSGTEALAILAEYECRAVITDHKMPHMTGLELGRTIDAQFAGSASRPLMIIMSGGMPTDDAEAAKEYFDAILSKPVRAAQIHKAILSISKVREPA